MNHIGEHIDNTIKEYERRIEVMKGFCAGKQIEFLPEVGSEYSITDAPKFNWDIHDYRVKSEPIYRPFKNAEEFLEEYSKHKIHFITDNNCTYRNISTVSGNTIIMQDHINYYTSLNFKNLVDDYKWVDTKMPCGVLE